MKQYTSTQKHTYTVKQLADLAGVSVRTLHHYDAIGLLSPASVGDNGYRYYSRNEVLRLQQILFFKELDFSLEEIARMMNSPHFDPLSALEDQRELLLQERSRIDNLIESLTELTHYMENNTDFEDVHKYVGLDDDTIADYKKEVYQKYDPKLVQESTRRVKQMGKEGLKKVQAEGETITQAIADNMKNGIASAEVQELIAKHHAHMNNFYDCTIEIYKGLGEMYIADPRFTAYYEKYAEGLAQFMHDAMQYYADHHQA